MTESNYEKTHNIFRLVILIAVVGGVLIGVIKNNPIIALISVVVGMILLISIQRKYKVTLADERIQQINLKAGNSTFRVFTVGFALLFFTNFYYPFIKPLTSEDVGSMFGYIASIMMVCNLVFYAYYKSRM
ncbi:MAG TPA: DUF2178 domain-containing protein [Candidatus Methanoperedens sp.]